MTRVTPRLAFFLPSLEGGGAERSFVELANRFVERGLRVDFVVARRTGPYLSELSQGIRLVDLAAPRKLQTVSRLARYLRAHQPDVLLAGLDQANAAAVVASRLAGIPSRCVISQRSLLRPAWQLERPRSWRIWVWLLGRIYPRARLVICNSYAAYRELTEDLGLPETKCAVVHNAVDVARIETLAREPLDDPWLRESAPPLIIAVASMLPIKDLATLIGAFAIVRRARDANLIILGDGPQRRALEEAARELEVEPYVRMPGFVSNPFPWISRARILVSSSLIEGCPNVIQQALACDTPIVATNCPGGTAELLENGRWGRLVPVSDSCAMATAIMNTLDERLPVDGRQRAADFDTLRITQRYLDLLLGEHYSADITHEN